MTPDDERRAAAVPGVPGGDNASALVRRMRECAEWHAGEVAGQALSAGADEVERLTRALADERDTVAFHVDLAESALRDLHAVCDALGARARRGDPLPAVTELVGVAQALRAQAGVPTAEVERLAAVARGAQYREREALAVVAMLRARLATEMEARDAAENRVENLEIALTIGPRVDEVRAALAQATAPDLAALARREAGSAHQWRQCRRCGRCFWLTAEESVPPHPTSDDPRLARACGWTVTTSEGSEGR